MSRLIQGTIHKQNTEITNNDQGKLIFTALKGAKLPSAALIRGNRLIQVCAFTESSNKVGEIFLGKVKNVLKNINACFVEIANQELIYLPLDHCNNAFLVNRCFDGRILEGDEIVIQIERDALKTKQAAASTKISLQGRYCVFSTGSAHIGISKKLSSDDRNRLEELLLREGLADDRLNWIQQAGMPSSYGVVIRTESAVAAESTILAELKTLENDFLNIFHKARHATCFSCLSSPKEQWQIIWEQIPTGEYDEIITDLPDLYERMQPFLASQDIPSRLYRDDSYSLNKLYGLNSKLKDALSRRIWLKSGSYLVFDTTEALSVFDVNSGKYELGKASEDSFYHINLEAAKEIALQIRLRNLSGIILADFINMQNPTRQESLLNYMRDLVKLDPVHTTAVDITPLGLMEITRKKVSKTLAQQFNNTEDKS